MNFKLVVTKTIYPFPESYVFRFFYILFSTYHADKDNIFLTGAVGFTFIFFLHNPHILNTFAFLEVGFSNTIVDFEMMGVDFILTSVGWLSGLFFSVYLYSLCHNEMFSSYNEL